MSAIVKCKKEKQPVPNFHAPEYMDRMSTKDLHYHVNIYLREIEKRRCISHGKSMDFEGERTNIWYGENSLVKQRAVCKSPTRPRSAQKQCVKGCIVVRKEGSKDEQNR